MFRTNTLVILACAVLAISATPTARQVDGIETATCATSIDDGCICENYIAARKAYNKDWSELAPTSIKNFEILGYNESTWATCHFSNEENTGCPATFMSKFENLTTIQQDAILELGTSPAVWNDKSVLAETCNVTEWAKCQAFNKNEVRFNADWAELLPADVLELKKLGWTAALWQSCDYDNITATTCPASDLKDWVELTPEEQTTAQNLGYFQDSWDIFAAYLTECKVDEYMTCVDIFNIETRFWGNWTLFSVEDKASLEALGWNATNLETCDTTDPQQTSCPSSEFKNWTELTEAERAGAAGIGYNNDTWDNYVTLVAPCGYESVEMCYDLINGAIYMATTPWAVLTDAERESCTTLFYSEANTTVAPTTCIPDGYQSNKTWNDLTPEKQAAASQLGFTQNSLDNADFLGEKCNMVAVVGCLMAGTWPGTGECSPTSVFYVQ